MKVISLGCNCEVAFFLERYEQETFPFDWIWCTLDFVYETMAHDYLAFTECEKLNAVWQPPYPHTYIFNNNCQGKSPRVCSAVSLHDADQHTPDQYQAAIPTINAKYARRFARLYTILQSSSPEEPIFLVRKVLNNDQGAVRRDPDTVPKLNALATLLLTKFPATNWTLCVVNNEHTLSDTTLAHDKVRIFGSFDQLAHYIELFS